MNELEQAQAILSLDPLPEDAERQIDALYERASDENKTLFVWVYEGLAIKQTEALGDGKSQRG